MFKRLLTVAIFVAVTSVTFGAVSVNAKHETNADINKITICHGTNAANNPYVIETVSKSAANGGGHDDHTSHVGPVASSFTIATALKKMHQTWGDIIPAYTWNGKEYPGVNWTTEGQLIYSSHCAYPVPTMPIAMIDHQVLCDVANQRAKITLTNTGQANGTVVLNGNGIVVAAESEVATYIPTPNGKVRIVLKIADAVVYDSELDCRAGGQGGVTDTPPTSNPVVTPPAPVAGSGEAAPAAPNSDAEITSLPYTAGNGVQFVALIAGLAAVITAAISVVAKKTYLKQI